MFGSETSVREALDWVLVKADAQEHANRVWNRTVRAGLLLAVLVIYGVLFAAVQGDVSMFMGLGTVIGIVVAAACIVIPEHVDKQPVHVELVRDRVRQVRELLDRMKYDFHPGRDIALSLDLDVLDEERKRISVTYGRLSGREKAKYVDAWLYLQVFTADRTRVRARVVTKSRFVNGSLWKQSHRLKVSVRPSSYYGDRSQWRNTALNQFIGTPRGVPMN